MYGGPMDSWNGLMAPGYGRQPFFGASNPSPSFGADLTNSTANLGADSSGPSMLSMDGIFGTPENGFQGWGMPAIQMGTGLVNSYLGMKNYGLAKDMLGENQRQFDMNYGNQRQMVNSELQDRQRARVASNPGAYQSVGDYMNQNRIR